MTKIWWDRHKSERAAKAAERQKAERKLEAGIVTPKPCLREGCIDLSISRGHQGDDSGLCPYHYDVTRHGLEWADENHPRGTTSKEVRHTKAYLRRRRRKALEGKITVAPKVTLASGQIITFEPSQQDDAPWLTNRMVLRSDYDRED